MEILLPVPQVLQNPELPNGCEITSLCEVLRYWGFAADKCDLADHYLPRSARWYGADPDRVYMGDPHKDDGSPETGYYCFAGPVVAAANAYLAAHGGGYTAHDLTGAGEDGLLRQLERGRPVIFWATLRFNDVQFDACGGYALPGGGYHRVFHTLHCMALCGADDTHFTVADPLALNRRVPRARFMEVYRQLGSRAVVLAPAGEQVPLTGVILSIPSLHPQAAKLQACFVSRTKKSAPPGGCAAAATRRGGILWRKGSVVLAAQLKVCLRMRADPGT